MTLNDLKVGDSQSATTATVNIWSSILQEVKNSTKKSPPPKSLLVLGDNESGRSTLVSRIKGIESVSKGIGLEYHYIDIKDEDRDDVQKLGVWIPDGDGACTNLLKFALNENNFENTLVVFVVSMSTPWSILDSLKKWANILSEHVRKLPLSEATRQKLVRRQQRIFQQYQEPDETTSATTTTPQPQQQQQHLQTPTTSGRKRSNAAMIGVDALGLGKEAGGAANDDDYMLLPLDADVLNQCLGLSMVVVVTKSDYTSVLDKEMDYRIEHFEFIQYHIRRFCLEYGAALFYTSVKDKRTHDKLYKYIVHKLYDFHFNLAANVVDRDSIFIPFGWDNAAKMNILLENSATIKSDSPYADVIARPTTRKPMQRDTDVVMAQDDQEFLAKLQILLNKVSPSTPSTKTDETGGSSQSSGMINATPSSTLKSSPHKPNAKSMANTPDSNNLKNFFQNLLNKNAPSPNTQTPPPTQPHPQSPPTSDSGHGKESANQPSTQSPP